VKLTGVELRRLRMPLVAPFRTSFGVQTERDVLLVRAVTTEAEGWGECVASSEPLYSHEYVGGAAEVIEQFLFPLLLDQPELTVETVQGLLAPVRGHRMAKAALETALLDAQLRAVDRPLASYFGAVRDRCPAGVSVGIADSIPALLDTVRGFLAEGYLRIKLKIEPGWDIEPVRAVREEFGDILLQVDANAAYTLADSSTLRRLDEFDLLLVEQPLADEDIRQHAELARLVRTPICLDESIHSAAAAADAIALGACQIVNIKPGRVGGYLEARRIHDLCQAHGVAVWCGGMLESGIGRAGNVALAALPGFSLPGDISASGRYFHTDLTEPFVLRDGHVDVPTGPGLGVAPIPELLSEWTTWQRWIAA
jgi:o-succinylbenzoate synthase